MTAHLLSTAQEWLGALLRWAHVVAAIGWIGSSFYFMWLDATLRRRQAMDPSVVGENWTVHGGGFYRTVKYRSAPPAMPETLHWFRLESYFTWLTGLALLGVTYYWSASTLLVDRGGDPRIGVLLSAAGLAGAWLFYDRLCKSSLRESPALLFAILFAALVGLSWAYDLYFTGRAAFLQTGAMMATLMTGNVLLVIIPNQRIVVADLKAGRVPSPEYGRIAKLRSTHNNYLTLPVVFLMISNHYPLATSPGWNWATLAAVLAMGAIVRNWFNRWEAGQTGAAVAWQWPAAVAFAAALFLASALLALPSERGGSVSPELALGILETRCASCHAAAPSDPAFAGPPADVVLESLADARRHAPRILLQSVRSTAMPPGNATGMSEEEREQLGLWLLAVSRE